MTSLAKIQGWPERKRSAALLFTLTVAQAGIYLSFLTKTYYWDGVLFSLYIEGVHKGTLPTSILFHPNHLVYSAFGFLLYSAALKFDPAIRAITVLQIVNALLSTVAGLCLFQLAKRWTHSTEWAAFCWILFAAGATWWIFSTDADAYVISVLLLILAISLLPRLVPVAICHICAMLFHELAIFAYFPILVAILTERNHKRIRNAVVYCVTTACCVAATYLACYETADRQTYPTLKSWITSYASDSGFTQSARQLITAYLASYTKLFFGGKLSLMREYFSLPMALFFALCIAAIACAIYFFRQPATPAREPLANPERLLLWSWLVPYALFLASWDPGSNFHKLFIWPPIVLLLGVYLKSRPRAWIAMAVAVAAWNLAAFIYPHSHIGADPVVELAEIVNRELPKDATVYFSVLDPDDWYLEYFAPGRTWLHLPPNARPASGCLETTALDQLKGVPLPLNPNMRWDLVNSHHNIRLECLR